MSGYLLIFLAWLLAVAIFCPLLGRYLERLSRYYPRPTRGQMKIEARKRLDEHYRKSGRPGMAQGSALRHG